MWLHLQFIDRVSPFPSGKAQSDEEPSVVEISPLANLHRNSKEKAVTLHIQQTCWVIVNLPTKVLFFSALSWLKRAQQHSVRNILPQNRRQAAAFRLAFPHVVTQFWGGMKLHARDSKLLLPSEDGAFMVSKQLWRRVLPRVQTGSWAAKELGESQTMPGSLKKKHQKTQSPPYFEDIVLSSKA